jgi:hypothetical protein
MALIVTVGADSPDLWLELQRAATDRRRDARTEALLRRLLLVDPPTKIEDKEVTG